MGVRFWILIGLTGLVLILLIASGDTGTTLGFETNTFATAAVAGLWALLIGSAVLNRGTSIAQAVKQLSIWLIIILALMAAYVFRYDAQDFASRFTGGLIPGSPISTVGDDGRETVTLVRSRNGHFEAVAGVNDASVRFLVDTGATNIVLSYADAREAGIDVDALLFNLPVQTANGRAFSATTRLERLYLGGIERSNVLATVAEQGRMNVSLLGQAFFETLSSYEKRGDRLTLRD
ncbi:MAG: TIGR02281 family clan AA aspartic protease [Ahrensia sp.]|nr:TIGR02281 family clan AA aspartic protease [Ahrensia sp.]